MFRTMCLVAAACCASLSACGPSGGVASAGTAPATVVLTPAERAAAAVADATLPSPATSPLASTITDDAALAFAWQALDAAAYGADAMLAVKPNLAGTPAAKRMADALEGSAVWLGIASNAQRAGQARSYAAALEQAKAALAGAQAAMADLKGK